MDCYSSVPQLISVWGLIIFAPVNTLSHPAQPFSSVSLMDQRPLTKDDAFGVRWVDKRACAKIIESYRNEGIFTPPPLGGMNWGAIALAGKGQIGVVNLNHIPALVQLLSSKDFNRAVANNGMPGWQLTEKARASYGMARRSVACSIADLGQCHAYVLLAFAPPRDEFIVFSR